MPVFDPRREPVRFTPKLAVALVALCAAGATMGTAAKPVAAKAKAAVEQAKSAKAKPEAAKSSKLSEAKGAKPKAEAAKATEMKATPKKSATAKATSTKTAEKNAPAKSAKAEGKTPTDTKTKTAEADAKSKDAPVKDAPVKEAPVKTAAAKDAPVKEIQYGKPQAIRVKLRKGETLEAAIRRAEASPEDAKAAAARIEKALGKAPGAGQLFSVEVAPREGRVGAGRLMALDMKGSAFEPVSLKRGKAGEWSLAARVKTEAATSADNDASEVGGAQRAKLITGEVRGSLYGSARKAGVGSGQVGEIVKAFAAKVDFQRDLKAGDKFTVVYDDDGKLIYAKIKSKGSYRFARQDGRVLWLDDDGRSLKSGLLRTPVDGARMSSRFGLRIHPILGYAKMHQGVDFAAAHGTPIMAAGDGEVVEIKRWGGYGNWLRIRHSGGFESGYAHLSRYASGLSVGDKVRQGQLVAYVGSTGASTGPHLHHEIWLNGKRVDPKGARIPSGFALEGKELVAFKAQQAAVKAALNRQETRLAKGKEKTKVAGLRPAKDA
jgi:murein DD-endopeptidase MepM/ murein hydrolase activator NlpD